MQVIPTKPNQLDFEKLLNDSPLAFYTCDPHGYLTYFNKAAVALWGHTPLIGKDMWCGSLKIFYPNGSPMPLEECPMAITLKTKIAIEGREIMIETPSKKILNLLVFPRPVFNEEGELTGAHNTLVDISSKKMEEERQAIFSAIIASSDDAIISKNLSGIIMSWNSGAQKIFGYTEEEVVGKHVSILIPPAFQKEEEYIIGNIKAGKKIDHFQTTRISKSGKEIQISLTVSPVKDINGNIIGASKIARDISEHLQKEQVIKLNAERLKVLNAIGKSISASLDEQSILQLVTDASTKITGAAFGAFFYNTLDERGEFYNLFTVSGTPRESFEKFGKPYITQLFAPTFQGEEILRVDDITKDPRYGKNSPHNGIPKGHLPVISYLAVPVKIADGNVIGGLFFGHPEPAMFTQEHENIVSNIVSQASVALNNCKLFLQVKTLSQKKDEFIAVASHELKTPITTIKGYLQILQKSNLEKTEKFFLEKSLNQAEKLNSLVGDLLDISKIQLGKLDIFYENFNLRELLLDVVETFQHSSKSHTIILIGMGEDLFIEADRQRIEQVITNLMTNAVKYSPGADKVTISVSCDNVQVTVTIKDEGIGISSTQQKSIFTRFYRAEENSNISGLGLGLYLSKEIILQHKGTIDVASELGKGAEFSFSIPLKKQL